MKLIKYLNYRRLFITVYLINIVIISLVNALDPSHQIYSSSIQYYLMISGIIFAIFLIYDYRKISLQIRNIQELVRRNDVTSTLELLEKDDYLKREYFLLFEHLYISYSEKTRELINEKKDFEDFISSWIHAIKTPITGLRLKQESDINIDEKIGKEVDSIDYYVEQSLFYHRLGSFSNDYIIQEVPLKPTCHKAIKKFSRIFIGKRIAMNIDIVDEVILSDEKWLTFIIGQVLSNALKYTPQGGKISIVSEEQKLIISDSGIGIPSEDLYRVFDKGFTGHNGRVEEQSTGMGLYLVKKMSDALGHEITITSSPDEGTTFTLSFAKMTDYHNITKL